MGHLQGRPSLTCCISSGRDARIINTGSLVVGLSNAHNCRVRSRYSNIRSNDPCGRIGPVRRCRGATSPHKDHISNFGPRCKTPALPALRALQRIVSRGSL